MPITPQFLDDLRSRLTLSDVIGGRVKLVRAGREFKACCPFHKEKSPSFYVNDDKQFFHCFGCGAHGDAVGFVMRYENRSFPEAVEQLAAAAGLKMPEFSREDQGLAQEQKSFYALMEAAAQWFEGQLALPKNADVMGYLTGRGLAQGTIAGFRLGYAPPDDKALLTQLRQAGFSDDQMITMGIVKRRERDGGLYGFFRDRVMFPVCDRAGRVVAFGGRVLPDHLRPPDRGSDFKPPKYLNSPETPLFQKGRMVYAQAQARMAAGDGARIVVVEGYMDVIACHQAGVKGAVAPLGTALTDDQIMLLWKMIPGREKIITLCFDGDEAGIRAAARAAERLMPMLKPDHSATIAFLPQGEDPDTLIAARGVGAFQQILEVGQGLADYWWTMCMSRRNLSQPEDRAGLESELARLADRITDSGTKYHYQKFFREKLAAQLRPPPRPFVKGGKSVAPVISPALARPTGQNSRAVDVLLAVLIQNPNIFNQVDEIIGNLYVEDDEKDALRQDLMAVLSEGDYTESEKLRARLTEINPAHGQLITYLCSDAVTIHARFAKEGAEESDILAGFHDVYAQITRRAAGRGQGR